MDELNGDIPLQLMVLALLGSSSSTASGKEFLALVTVALVEVLSPRPRRYSNWCHRRVIRCPIVVSF